MNTSLSEQLKKATNPYHNKLDQLALLKNLLAADIKPKQYEMAIWYFYHCFNQWQPILDEAKHIFEPPPFACLNNQLNALTAEVAHFDYQISPNVYMMPAIASIETYLGYSYVLTGSQVGARFILKRLQHSAIAHLYTFDYYNELSKRTIDISQWKSELDALVSQGSYDSQAIIDGAIDCFVQLIGWFEQDVTMNPIETS
jgi:heme oxygenase